MNANLYCHDKVAQPGSSIYYSVLYSPQSLRDPIIALRAFFQEIIEIMLECQDPTLANTKLIWWQTELSALQLKTPRHPITQQLLLIHSQLDFSALNNILTTVISDLHTPVYEKEFKLNLYYQNTAGTLERLLLPLYKMDDKNTGDALAALGIFIYRVNHLRHCRLSLQHGRTYIAGDTLIKHNVTLKQLAQFQTTENIRELLKDHANLANQYYHQALDLLPNHSRRNIRPTLRLAKIHHALLDEIIRADYSVLQERISLTPLRKWWIGWRTK